MKIDFGKGGKLKVRTYGDPCLAAKAKKVDKVDGDVVKLGEMMIEAMRKYDGVGLAANQVGISLRMIVLEIPAPKDAAFPLSPGEMELLQKMPLVILNPEITSFSQVLETREEGCLSVPKIYAEVERPASAHVKGQVLGGAGFSLDCGGLLGRAFQHEIDHLDGIVFVDRLSDSEYAKIKPELDKLIKSTGRKSVLRRIIGALKG